MDSPSSGCEERYQFVVSALNPDSNYWAIIGFGDYPTARHFVYDCNPESLGWLIGIAPGSFYMGDKKYKWLVYFHVDRA